MLAIGVEMKNKGFLTQVRIAHFVQSKKRELVGQL
jgi:hypothetical protein